MRLELTFHVGIQSEEWISHFKSDKSLGTSIFPGARQKKTVIVPSFQVPKKQMEKQESKTRLPVFKKLIEENVGHESSKDESDSDFDQ